MSKAFAITKHVRISPRKARLAAGLIRGLPVSRAIEQLLFCNLKGGRLLKKTLDSAVANAITQNEALKEDLIVSEVRIDQGVVFKRAKPKNRGGRHPIMKRTSHFTVVVSTEE